MNFERLCFALTTFATLTVIVFVRTEQIASERSEYSVISHNFRFQGPNIKCYSLFVVFCETLGIHHYMIILDSLISEVLQIVIWTFAPLLLNISAEVRQLCHNFYRNFGIYSLIFDRIQRHFCIRNIIQRVHNSKYIYLKIRCI